MKNLRNKFATLFCGIGLLIGVNGIVGVSDADIKYKKFDKSGFSVQVGSSHYVGVEEEFCFVEVSNKKNKNSGCTYDGNIHTAFSYCPESKRSLYETDIYDKNDDGWLQTLHKWQKTGEGAFESSERTGAVTSDASYEDIPGKPKGLPYNVPFRLVVDLDAGEEYARGTFTNEKDALKWADDMIDLFLTKR